MHTVGAYPPFRRPFLPGLYGDVLRARALWLVGVCGSELQPGPWGEAFRLCVHHIQSPDVVVRHPESWNLGISQPAALPWCSPLPGHMLYWAGC